MAVLPGERQLRWVEVNLWVQHAAVLVGLRDLRRGPPPDLSELLEGVGVHGNEGPERARLWARRLLVRCWLLRRLGRGMLMLSGVLLRRLDLYVLLAMQRLLPLSRLFVLRRLTLLLVRLCIAGLPLWL